MSSKRFNKLKEIKKETNSETIEKLLPIVKKKLYYKIWWSDWFKFSN